MICKLFSYPVTNLGIPLGHIPGVFLMAYMRSQLQVAAAEVPVVLSLTPSIVQIMELVEAAGAANVLRNFI